jgi:alanyl-tRNA synthetase
MALFGEKYGDWVRVVEVDDVSRELCGGTHVANTAEVGIVAIVSEGSSAANVRRIEALTGPAAIDHYRRRSDELDEVGRVLRDSRNPVAAAQRAAAEHAELEKLRKAERKAAASAGAAELAERAADVNGVKVITAVAEEGESLADLAHSVQQRAGGGAVVLGAAADGKAALVASFGQDAVDKGAAAVDVIREASQVVGGGGGGRPDFATGGGPDSERLEEALEVAGKAIERALS